MALIMRWVLHSACQALGYPENEGHAKKNLKVGPTGMVVKPSSSSSSSSCGFQMPLHYPRYKKQDYEKMEEWRVDLLFGQYGLCFEGSIDEKRAYAMGAFLWPDQY